MRIGVVVDTSSWDSLRREGEAAESVGLDLCWIEDDQDGATAMVAACALAAVTRDIRVVAEVAAGNHPIGLAEELAVTDQLLGGRLTAVLTADDVRLAQETLEALELALAPHPFRHEGERWQIPRSPTGLVRVTPAPSQLELPLWLRGDRLAELAEARRLPLVSGAPRSRVAGRRTPEIKPTEHDIDVTVSALLTARDQGVDTCALRIPPGPIEERLRAIVELGSRVRPRVQIDSLPAGVVEGWDAPDS
jgi:alkanesulfonate monooxygenase SsuD/methylene tetrahydromethanopterin reductase-like flavin-dependent oxidoreductase (luciferase family)